MRFETLADLYRPNAALHGERVAIVHGDTRITHAELLRQAEGLAQHFAARELAPGERVAILARNRPEYLVALAACELAGYVAVGLNHRLAPQELGAICADCAPALLVADPALGALAGELQDGWKAPRGALVMGSDEFRSACATPPGEATRAGAVHPDALACLLYTSGTTGRPKGVMLTQRGLAATARSMALETGAQADDLLAAVMPLFHIGARCKSLGYALRGAGVLLVEQFDPADYLAQTRRHAATAWHLAPSMLQAVLEALGRTPGATAPVLRAIHYAAAPIPLPVLRAALERFGPVLRQYYGMTETGATGTVLGPGDHRLPAAGEAPDAVLSSAGQPALDVEVRVVRDDGAAAAAGEPGEVEIRSAANMLGYWKQPQATQEALHDGWMRTGDIGRLDARSYLTLLDRKKDMLISGGENIFPREVEDALLAHPAVAEAAVIGVPDARWGEAVQAWVVLRPGAEAGAPELVDHVKSRIASYKKPREVRFVATLPRLATGKVDKKALRVLARASIPEAGDSR